MKKNYNLGAMPEVIHVKHFSCSNQLRQNITGFGLNIFYFKINYRQHRHIYIKYEYSNLKNGEKESKMFVMCFFFS